MINSKRIYKGFRDLKVYDEVARMLSSMMENMMIIETNIIC